MTPLSVIFFGSTDQSVIVLEKLCQYQSPTVTLSICCIVTQPPRPAGRHQELTPTPVETWAKQHKKTVLSFPSDPKTPWLYADEQAVIDALAPMKVDLLVSASYGQKIPTQTIASARYGGLNVHPSLLPRWRGADPAPWAILSGDAQTGVTIVTLAQQFDQGRIIAQKKIPLLPTDTTTTLYPKLFTLGAELLIQSLQRLASKGVALKGSPQEKSPTPYARRLTKQDGFVSWDDVQSAADGRGDAVSIDRKFRALSPWPGLWTLFHEKRLKILGVHLKGTNLVIDQIQLEGKKPVSFRQFSSSYLAS